MKGKKPKWGVGEGGKEVEGKRKKVNNGGTNYSSHLPSNIPALTQTHPEWNKTIVGLLKF